MSIQRLTRDFFDANLGQVIMANSSAAAQIALAGLVGAVARTPLLQIVWKALRSKGFLDSIEQLIQHHLGHPVSPTL